MGVMVVSTSTGSLAPVLTEKARMNPVALNWDLRY